jgi:DnaJ family protein C protein 17
MKPPSGPNWFGLLGLTPEATPKEINKAYKKLALKYHPDRTKGDKKKEALFIKVKEAYEVLGDDKERLKYLEEFRKVGAKVKRNADRTEKMDAKRRKMKEDLLAREKVAENQRAEKNKNYASRQAEAKRQQDINRLREEGRRQREDFTPRKQDTPSSAANSAADESANFEFEAMAAQRAVERSEKRKMQIKVKWSKRSQHEGESFSDDGIAALFKKYGYVEAVEIGKKGKSATVTFDTEKAARAAIEAHDTDEELSVFKDIESCSLSQHRPEPNDSASAAVDGRTAASDLGSKDPFGGEDATAGGGADLGGGGTGAAIDPTAIDPDAGSSLAALEAQLFAKMMGGA